MYSIQDFTRHVRGDLFGGITAAIVALPLALAFGIASGVGPVAGIYGAVVVGFFASLFGGTPTQISGPTGPMTVVMTAMTAQYLALYPDSGLALAFTTVFLGGCLQILIGLLRLGKYIIMVPYPVISGFMSGIGVIIIILQLGPLLGFQASTGILDSVSLLPEQLLDIDLGAFVVGAASLSIVFLWRGRYNRIVPSPLLALVVTTIAVQVFFPNSEVDRIGSIPAAVPGLQFPTISMDLLQPMLTNALMLAMLGSIDSLLTSLVADNVTATQHDSDRELIGQGIGNACAGLLGGLPGAGATMRTMVNIQAGGQGPLSGIVHALMLLTVAGGLGFLFEPIPLAALAGILIKVGIDIIDWPYLKQLFRMPVFSAALMLLVLLLTVFVDLITAVFVGVFIKNMVTIRQLSELELGSVILSNGSESRKGISEEERNLLLERNGEAVLVRITGPLSYAVGRGLTQRFRNEIHNAKLLIIDLSDASIIGISTAMVLSNLVKEAMSNNTTVKLIGADSSHHHELKQMGLIDLVGLNNHASSLSEAFSRT